MPVLGVDPNDVSIEVNENHIISIRGERRCTEHCRSESTHLQECSNGKFSRDIALSVGIEHDKIQASFKFGALTIIAPKKDKESSRRIKIKNLELQGSALFST